MFDPQQMLIMVGVLLALVFSGVHIAVSLGVTSLLGIYLMTEQIIAGEKVPAFLK